VRRDRTQWPCLRRKRAARNPPAEGGARGAAGAGAEAEGGDGEGDGDGESIGDYDGGGSNLGCYDDRDLEVANRC